MSEYSDPTSATFTEPTVEPVEAGRLQVPCPECGVGFRDNRTLGLHRRNHHGVPGASSQRNGTGKRRGRPPGARNKAQAQVTQQYSEVWSDDRRVILMENRTGKLLHATWID